MPTILIDYLTVSMPMTLYNFESMSEKLNTKVEDYTVYEHSHYRRANMNRCAILGGIKIHWQDRLSLVGDIEPLLILEMSGTGCRLLESLNPDINWIEFIESILSNEGTNIARLDVACDDKPTEEETPLLSYDTIERHVSQRKYISLANRVIYTNGAEQNIVFGSPKSDRRLRIYNKALERKYDGHWIRCEFQLRNDTALSFFMRCLELGDIGKTYCGMLFDYLRFTREVNDSDNKNQSRLTVCRWWHKFCNFSKKIKGFYIGGLEYNMQSLLDYISIQTASSIQTFLSMGNDFEDLKKIIDCASINKQQEFLMRTYWLEQAIRRTYTPKTKMLPDGDYEF